MEALWEICHTPEKRIVYCIQWCIERQVRYYMCRCEHFDSLTYGQWHYSTRLDVDLARLEGWSYWYGYTTAISSGPQDCSELSQ